MSNSSLNFQKATEADVDELIALEKKLDGSHLYSAMTNRKESIEFIKNNTVHLIRLKRLVVGDVSYEMKSSSHAHISGLAVDPEFQGKGIGRKAIEHVLNELLGIELVDLVTHPNNAKAMALYKSLGFREGERIENYYGDGEPRIVLHLTRPIPR